MKKWQAYLDKGTPDNPNTEDLCSTDSLGHGKFKKNFQLTKQELIEIMKAIK